MRRFHFGLDSWIIQDGNYPDFEAGEVFDFAMEFYPLEIHSMAQASTPCLTHEEGSEYTFTGHPVFLSDKVVVMDVGVLCYREKPSRFLDVSKKDAWFAGKLSLGVDPFFYKDSLRKIKGMPSLTYTWKLHEILLETTPWECSHVDGSQIFTRRADVARSFRTIVRTDAWNDDDGSASYVLVCEGR